MEGIDHWVDTLLSPLAVGLSALIFFEIPVGGTGVPRVVLWLVAAGVFFTFRLGLISIRGFGHALALVSGRSSSGEARSDGEVSHFQALATAVSGTVGIGNIGGVAIAIAIAISMGRRCARR